MLPRFELEQYLLEHEHKASLSLCSSGLESITLPELLALADADSLNQWTKLSLDYEHPYGLVLLKEEISKQYTSIAPDEVGVFAGAAEGILCVLQGLLNVTDHAVVVTPCYQSLASIPASRCEVSYVGLEESNGWQLDLEKIVEALRPETRLIIINFPNNPTGALPDWETIAGLIEIARQRNIYLFSDEVYRLMEIDPADRLPAIADCYERGISISSMSKPYGLPGLRIGWVATKASEVLQTATRIKHYTSICPNSASEILALMALRAQGPLLERNRNMMLANFSQMSRFFEQARERFEWTAPRGGCIGFPKLLSMEPVEAFALRFLEEEEVLILPGSLYGVHSNRFRISYGRSTMSEALARFERFLSPESPV